jgi:hypothetical protein
VVTIRRTHRNSAPFLARADHARLWRIVEGAVLDALQNHPNYLTPLGESAAVASITKRVVGQLIGAAKTTHQGSRLGGCNPASSGLLDATTAEPCTGSAQRAAVACRAHLTNESATHEQQ